MDFLQKATAKLDVQDKLPGQLKDMLGGEHKDKQGEGKHLAQAHDDGAGFPQGLRPSDWMGDLVARGIVPATAKVTEFRYPGSHDAATYGSGLESFSYKCQDKNFYDQMMIGQRCFDLRLAPSEDKKKFIPVHGIAKNTADDFNQGPKRAEKDDLVSQIFRFAKDHPSELLVFQVRVEGLEGTQDAFAEAIFHHLGERLLEAPQDGRVPTYQEAMNSNRNIIFGVTAKLPQPAEKYIWHVGPDTKHWMGDGDQMLWNEPTWQSGDVTKVLASTEDFMRKNRDKTLKRDRFWVAFLQLTPVLGQNFSTFIKDGGSVRPKDLALGGGLGTHGAFEGSNQKVRDSGVFQKPIWRNNASCVLYDFCDIKTTGAIVAMNIGAEFSGGGQGARPGEEHDSPGRGERGGRGGRGGGRGGRGDHDGPLEPRFDDDRRDERGEGRGEHRGGRGGRGRGEHERFE